MVAIPRAHSLTTEAIYQAYAASRGEAFDGMGISISILGSECDRHLWYDLRWASQPEVIDGLKAITFETGNIEEARLMKVDEVDERGKQYRASAVAGHVRGKTDGKVLNLPENPTKWHVAEAKSMKDEYWQKVKKLGVRAGYYDHFVQLNIYLELFGYEDGLYICRNKNTGEVYCEIIKVDHYDADRLLKRAERVVKSVNPPGKLHKDHNAKMAFKCKHLCKHLDVCHKNNFARVSCRTCLHATPEMIGDAAWSCARHGKPLTLAEQKNGCDDHLFIPALVPGEVIDSSDDGWVLYTLHDGRQWRDGRPDSLRYFHHADTCSVFAREGEPDDWPSDLEEIDAVQFAHLQAHYASPSED
jgi:hypothetical protein